MTPPLSRAYYNEWDAYAAQWLRNLIAAGHLPAGDVDERSIAEVTADDLRGYTQVHFFAGIGGWPYAARLAGWPDDEPLWTGSCPCQPYSQAGKGLGDADPRNLWPAMHRLIAECRPDCVIGEQVASAIGHGWLDGISADLEAEDYAVGAVVLGAHSVGAPHIRQRLFWVAESGRASDERLLRSGEAPGPAGATQGEARERERRGPDARRGGATLGLADRQGDGWREGGPVAASGAWDDAEWLPCADGKARRIEPGLEPLVDGAAFQLGSGSPFEGRSRAGMLRAYGNAIVAPLAVEFITVVRAALRETEGA